VVTDANDDDGDDEGGENISDIRTAKRVEGFHRHKEDNRKQTEVQLQMT